jgi:hypothetical protein
VPSGEGPRKVGPPLGTSISLREKEKERERDCSLSSFLRFLLWFFLTISRLHYCCRNVWRIKIKSVAEFLLLDLSASLGKKLIIFFSYGTFLCFWIQILRFCGLGFEECCVVLCFFVTRELLLWMLLEECQNKKQLWIWEQNCCSLIEEEQPSVWLQLVFLFASSEN